MENDFRKRIDELRPTIIAVLIMGLIIVSFTIIMIRFGVLKTFILKFISVIKPFIYGFVIAYLLKPAKNIIENFLVNTVKLKKNLARNISVLASIALGIVLIYILIALLIPQLLQSITTLYYALPRMMRQLEFILTEISGNNEVVDNYIGEMITEVTAELKNLMQDGIMPYLNKLVSGLGESVVNIFKMFLNLLVGVIVSVYILTGSEKFKKQLNLILSCIFSTKALALIKDEVHYADKMFTGFINGKIVDSAIVGVICYICCSFLKMPYPILISVIVGVTNVIPFFGPYIGAIPSAIIILTVAPMKCLVFVIFIIILQQVDGNIIGPKILGNTTGLSPFWVLFSILFFGGFFGFVGMIIGVPMFAVIYDIIRKLVLNRLRKKGLQYMIDDYKNS